MRKNELGRKLVVEINDVEKARKRIMKFVGISID